MTGEAPTASAVISAPRSHLAGETDRRLPAAREMTQKIWSFLQRHGNLKIQSEAMAAFDW